MHVASYNYFKSLEVPASTGYFGASNWMFLASYVCSYA